MIIEVRKTYITDKVNYLKRQLDYHPAAIIQHKTKILHYYYLIQSNLYKECTKFDELSIIYNDVYSLTQQCNILLQDDIIQSIIDFLYILYYCYCIYIFYIEMNWAIWE